MARHEAGFTGESEDDRDHLIHQSSPDRDAVRGWHHLTIPEQVVGAVVFMLLFAGVESSSSIPPFIAAPVLVVIYSALASVYVRRCAPWHGPHVIRRNPGAREIGSLWSRVRQWFMVPGRRGLLAAAAGIFLVVCGLANAASDSSLLHDLNAHGVPANATVTKVDRDTGPRAYGTLVAISLTFDVRPGVAVTEDDPIIDTVPDDIADGDRVRVTFDPQAPENVLITTQLDNGHVTDDHLAALLGAVVAASGFGWWLVKRSNRRSRLATE